jgi:hypothetical protein
VKRTVSIQVDLVVNGKTEEDIKRAAKNASERFNGKYNHMGASGKQESGEGFWDWQLSKKDANVLAYSKDEQTQS